MKAILAIIIENAVTLGSNLYRIICQIRGKLNLEIGKLIAELTQRMNLVKCGETRWQTSLEGDDGIVRTFTEKWSQILGCNRFIHRYKSFARS